MKLPATSGLQTRAARPHLVWFVITLILAGGMALRVAAAHGELWLDEVWSINLARQADGIIDILAFTHRDNNHQLNTILLQWLDGWSLDPVHRLPALVFGAGTILAAATVARRWGPESMIIAALLFSGSYLQIHFASEARGYSSLLFFSLTAVMCLDAFAQKPTWARWTGLMISCILGLLAHALYLHVMVALLIWAAIMPLPAERATCRISLLVRCFALPLTLVVFYGVLHLRHLIPGGGPQRVGLDVLSSLASVWLGLSPGGLRWPALIVVASIVVLTLAYLFRTRDQWRWLFVTIVAPPSVLMLMTSHPQMLYERYLLIPATFLLLSIAPLLARGWQRKGIMRGLVILVILAYMGSNLSRTNELLQSGRLHYRQVVLGLLEETDARIINVASDHDFRHGTMIRFYTEDLPAGRTIKYHGAYVHPSEGVDWFLTHQFAFNHESTESTLSIRDHEYRLTRSYPGSFLSGWRVNLYQRVE